MTAPPGATAWLDLLDALEERNRRYAAFLRGGPAVPEFEIATIEAMPIELALPVQLLLAETQRLEQLAATHAELAGRALYYGRT